MKYIDNNILQINIIETVSPNYLCTSCGKDFETGDKRIHWRLKTPRSAKYHSGSFWHIHCVECAMNTIREWIVNLSTVNLSSFLSSPKS